MQAWQDEQNDEERARLETDGAFHLPEASIEAEDQDEADGDSSDDNMQDAELDFGGKGGRQQRLFRMRGAPKTSPDDARPVTTPQHILGLAKVRQVWPHMISMPCVRLHRDKTVLACCHLML